MEPTATVNRTPTVEPTETSTIVPTTTSRKNLPGPPFRTYRAETTTWADRGCIPDSTPENKGGARLSEAVDVESMQGGGYNIGYITNGEWVEYT